MNSMNSPMMKGLTPGAAMNAPNTPSASDMPTAKPATSSSSARGSITPRAGPTRQNSNTSDVSSSSSSSTFALAYSASSASASSRRGKGNGTRAVADGEDGGDTSESDYGGLAYADDTDYEEEKTGTIQIRDGAGVGGSKARLSVNSRMSRNSRRTTRDGVTPTPTPLTPRERDQRSRPVSGSVYSDDEDDLNDLKNRLLLGSFPSPPSSPPANTISISNPLSGSISNSISQRTRTLSNASISQRTRAPSTTSVSSSKSSVSSKSTKSKTASVIPTSPSPTSSSRSSAIAIAKALGLSRSSTEGETSERLIGGPGAPGVARTLSGKSVKSVSGRIVERGRSVDDVKSTGGNQDGGGRNRSATISSLRSVDSIGRNRSATISSMKSMRSLKSLKSDESGSGPEAGRARSGTGGSGTSGSGSAAGYGYGSSSGSVPALNTQELTQTLKELMTDDPSSPNASTLRFGSAPRPIRPPRPIGIGLRDDGPSPPMSPHRNYTFDSTSSLDNLNLDSLSTAIPAPPPIPNSIRASSNSMIKLAHRSNTVGVTTPYSLITDAVDKLTKLPARSKTERASKAVVPGGGGIAGYGTGSEHKNTKKIKVCIRCDKRIEDGRWISVELPGSKGVGAGASFNAGSAGGEKEKKDKGVLCEKCWKNMYLPKCRRCNLPIEKQAVSSSDGQLKGKYHKDCFNCFTCNQPFPDKIFYVYDGRPLCKYHYHETNDSLCAAATCGQPIEGPCAVSHAGDRYHPEHFTCEWMLCEKHARAGDRDRGLWVDGEDEDERFGVEGSYGVGAGHGSGTAMKRMTRFVDLNALGELR
ncbi:hypothetical protein BDP27DRAFT_1337379 [Rhodocollybia butyracea]|uniref:LIM zinc-binding domain-containing protein n=1 Tax=Rhodocollybia butyracea TaxID=206335 RepID=A0A9P5PEK3_9AGAR|nr:hypothetical protein BDP27DRAFT_1337379 [Rhodocollybia butyracea]